MKDVRIQIPERKNGFIIKIIADGEYCGFGFARSKRHFSIELGFIAIRFFRMSEEYNMFLESMSYLSVCTDLTIDVVKRE